MRYIRSPAANGQATNRSAVSADRRQYPRANPAPAMYSSPLTPTGTGRRAASRTYDRILSSGPPIGTRTPARSAPESGRWVAKVVASVGP